MKTELLKSAHDVVRHARGDRDAQLVYLLEAMIDRIQQLEARLDCLSDAMTARNTQLEARLDNAKPKSEDVISDALEFERNVLSVIECNSGSVYSHIEAEIEEKLDQQLGSYAFCEAVNEAIDSSSLHDAIVDAVGDAEDIVRKGLRAIL